MVGGRVSGIACGKWELGKGHLVSTALGKCYLICIYLFVISKLTHVSFVYS